MQKVYLPSSFAKCIENCGYQIFVRITRFVTLVFRPDYQTFCLRSTPVKYHILSVALHKTSCCFSYEVAPREPNSETDEDGETGGEDVSRSVHVNSRNILHATLFGFRFG